MTIVKRFLLTLFLIIYSCSAAANYNITDYQRVFLPVYSEHGDFLMAIRVFKMNEIPSFLVVDPETLQTKVMPVKTLLPRDFRQKDKPGYFTRWNIASTRYYQLLHKTTAAPYVLENQGIKHAQHGKHGNVLTIDLCPSTKPFESEFFNSLVKLSETSNKPIPVTIAISGMWLIEHPEEFQWLIAQEKDKKLAITWANHSFSHVYYDDLPYSENFLRSPETNIELEILTTEKYLLESGEVPSVFFRFPGLVSSKKLIRQLRQYGLIPLGTDTWLARNQTIIPGGILLVHGNSNEHEGIVKLLPILKELNWLDIKSAV
ncbi:Uncharacterised protein [Legionella longbeachae]|uniref:Uncharacterized protein n=3 Tax=Legionella oakridgensis TaxID=29423 RepID=A0A0W0X4G9_9GAMM|nr:hypothetical protein Loak_0919 [Legionella oakridgensis]STY20031.1 Uncharacterised protein [Legionella longbeachae]